MSLTLVLQFPLWVCVDYCPDAVTSALFLGSSIERREWQSWSPNQQWPSSWMRPPHGGSTSMASRTTMAQTFRTSPWTSRRLLTSSWKRRPVPVKAWTCWGSLYFLQLWVSVLYASCKHLSTKHPRNTIITAWKLPCRCSLVMIIFTWLHKQQVYFPFFFYNPHYRNNAGENGTQWIRLGQLLSEFEWSSFEDCCHRHLVRESQDIWKQLQQYISLSPTPIFSGILNLLHQNLIKYFLSMKYISIKQIYTYLYISV